MVRRAFTRWNKYLEANACCTTASILSMPAPLRWRPSLAKYSLRGRPSNKKQENEGMKIEDPFDFAHHFSKAKFKPYTKCRYKSKPRTLGRIEENRIIASEFLFRITSRSTLKLRNNSWIPTCWTLPDSTRVDKSFVPTWTNIFVNPFTLTSRKRMRSHNRAAVSPP